LYNYWEIVHNFIFLIFKERFITSYSYSTKKSKWNIAKGKYDRNLKMAPGFGLDKFFRSVFFGGACNPYVVGDGLEKSETNENVFKRFCSTSFLLTNE